MTARSSTTLKKYSVFTNLRRASVDSEQTHRIAALNDHVKNLTQEIAELRGQINNTTSDDKYALTKAKLIRLMKDMGYYD